MPLIAGWCAEEMGAEAAAAAKWKPARLERFNAHILRFAAGQWLGWDGDTELGEQEAQAVGRVLDTYLGSRELSKNPAQLAKYYQAYTDGLFVANTCQFVDLLAAHKEQPTYLYRLAYPAPASLSGLTGTPASFKTIAYPIVYAVSPLKLMARMVANSLFNWDVLRNRDNKLCVHVDDVFLMWEASGGLHLTQRWSEEDVTGQ